MRIFRILAIVSVLSIFAIPSRADSSTPLYDVTGSLSVTGTSACAGPCVETIDFSFVVDSDLGTAGPAIVTGSSGPLGAFTGGSCCGDDKGTYIPFFGPGTEIDLYVAANVFGNQFDPLFSPFSEFYMCLSGSSPSCSADFSEFTLGTAQYTITSVAGADPPAQTPEPGMLPLLLVGLLAVMGLTLKRNRKNITA